MNWNVTKREEILHALNMLEVVIDEDEPKELLLEWVSHIYDLISEVKTEE